MPPTVSDRDWRRFLVANRSAEPALLEQAELGGGKSPALHRSARRLDLGALAHFRHAGSVVRDAAERLAPRTLSNFPHEAR